jgi:hypothetical protein
MVEQNTVNICVECSIHSKGFLRIRAGLVRRLFWVEIQLCSNHNNPIVNINKFIYIKLYIYKFIYLKAYCFKFIIIFLINLKSLFFVQNIKIDLFFNFLCLLV